MTAARRKKTAEQACGRRGQEQEQVSSDGDGGEHRARGGDQERSDDASEEWSGDNTEKSEGSSTEEEEITAGGGGVGKGDADGDGVGRAGKRRGRATWGSAGRRRQHKEGFLRSCQQGRSVGPPWGEAGAKGGKRRQAGK